MTYFSTNILLVGALRYFQITVHNDTLPQLPMGNNFTGKICAEETAVGPEGYTKTYICSETMSGKYVVIQNTKTSNVLSICEIEIFEGNVLKVICF